MMPEIDQTTNQSDAETGVFNDPRQYYQGVHVPTGETYSDFWKWWKALCAEMDSKPKHIIRTDRSKKK